MYGFEHVSSPFKRISYTIGENVGNHFMAFTKVSLTIEMKLVQAARFWHWQRSFLSSVIMGKSFLSIGFFSVRHCMMSLKWTGSHFPLTDVGFSIHERQVGFSPWHSVVYCTVVPLQAFTNTQDFYIVLFVSFALVSKSIMVFFCWEH